MSEAPGARHFLDDRICCQHLQKFQLALQLLLAYYTERDFPDFSTILNWRNFLLNFKATPHN